MKKLIICVLLCLIAFWYTRASAQQTSIKIGTNPTSVTQSAVLEVEATNKGALLPRVALTSTTDVTTIASPANSLTVFNTATNNDVTPGYYYWSTPDAKWIRLQDKAIGDLRLVGNNNHITQDAGVGGNGTSVGTGANNIGIGIYSLFVNTTGNHNVGIGYSSLYQNTIGSDNTGVGLFSLYSNTTGNGNVAIGTGSSQNNRTGRYNVVVGFNALYNNTTGSSNVVNGVSALFFNTTGDYNTAFGSAAGQNITTGANNLALGYATNVASPTADNQMNINNAIFGTGMNGTVTAPAGLVGINTAAPTNTLHVKATANPLRLEGLQTGTIADNFVVADANGVLKTVAPAVFNANPWNLTGNAGTTAANFLGTTDAQPLRFRANNAEAMQIIPSGNVGVGVTPDDYSQHKLQVNSIRFGKPYDFLNQHYSFAQAPSAFSNAIAQKPFTLFAGNSFFDRSELLLGGSTNMNNEAAVQRIRFFTTPTKDTALGTERMVLDRDGNLGIGTSTPTNTLHISATANPIRLEGLQTGLLTDNVVVADANGVLKIIVPSALNANSWSLTGNASTNSGTNFIGTTDNVDLIFKRNNIQSGLIGAQSTAFGQGALNVASTGIYNQAFGVDALAANTTGQYNVGLGAEALNSNTTGNENVGLGIASLSTNTTASYNTGIGSFALFSNVNGSQNTAVGRFAMRLNTIGTSNTAIGVQALEANDSGSSNNAVGYGAMLSNTTGSRNAVFGNSSLQQNQSGSNNVAFGESVLRITTGSGNVALGYKAGDNNIGSSNVFIGNEAASGIGGSNASPVSNRLIIANTGTYKPLIEGTFTTDGGNLTVNNSGAVTATAKAPANSSTFNVNGSMSASIVTVSANYTAADNDHTIIVKAAANGDVSITLPSPNSIKGRLYYIMGFANGFSGNLLVNARTQFASSYANGLNSSIIVQSDGTEWLVIKN